jgi:MFS family permease
VLFGGILVKYLGWQWIFYVNVPVGAIVLALTIPFVPESRAELAQRRFDAAGAITVTGGLALLVYAISKAPDVGWGSARVLLLIASVAILGIFICRDAVERAADAVRIFRIRSVLAASVVGFLLGAVIFANFLVLRTPRPAGAPLVSAQDRHHLPRDRGDDRDLGRVRR